MKNSNKYKSSAIDYYNTISDKYDDLLNTNPLHKIIREEVKQYFLENVNGKTVLDFGGGTGGDLAWLFEDGFTVIFCEPAERMKQIAVESFEKINSSDEVLFLKSESSDYRYWSNDNLPFEDKTDTVLSNFAVLNSIKDLNTLSEKLALITNKNAHLIVVVLNINVNYMIRNIINILESMIKGNGLTVKIKHGETYLTTYLHRRKILIKAMSEYFTFVRCFPLCDDSFMLFHFVRNEKIV